MSDAPLMMGVSGLRGVVGRSLTPDVVVRYAAGFGSWLVERCGQGATVVVGRDGRAGGDMIERLAIGGLQSVGVRVLTTGVAMTPTIGVVADTVAADGAMIVTASHNPQEWNGLKVLVSEPIESEGEEENGDDGMACAPDADTAAAIKQAYDTGRPAYADPTEFVDIDAVPEPHAMHAARVVGMMMELFGPEVFEQIGACGLLPRVVFDAVNASAVEIDGVFCRMIGVERVMLGGEPTGIFQHVPEPTRENLSGAGGLCDAVVGLRAGVGFAQDPDGDRLALIDEKGSYIGEEYTLAIAAEAVLSALGRDAKGMVLCANLSTSRLIDAIAARHKARVVRTAVGEANVVAGMGAQGALLGGEGNGGVILPMVTLVRDSLTAAGLTMALIARSGMPLSEIVRSMPPVVMIKRKQALSRREDCAGALERLDKGFKGAKVDRTDGVRIDLEEGWVHVRPSNTEPILRVIAEASSQAEAEKLADRASAMMAG